MTRFQIIKSSVCALAVAAIVGLSSGEAQAQHFGGGHFGHNNHGSHFNIGGWGGNHWGGGWAAPAHTWHDTSHFDYVPGGWQRHGNHFDYRPGQYQWHQDGHIDHNHH